MHTVPRTLPSSRFAATVATLVFAFACGTAFAAPISATLTGAQEVPPVDTKATGTAKFQLKADRSLSGSVKTKDIDGVAAHIHEGAPGVNGPVAIPLNKKNDHEWTVPVGTKLHRRADRVAEGRHALCKRAHRRAQRRRNPRAAEAIAR